MTKETEQAGTPATPATTQTAPGIQIIAQYVKDMSIENPNSPASIVGGWGTPETNVQINIRNQQLKDNAFETALMLRVEARSPSQDNKVSFIVELTYAATVQLNNVPEDKIQPVLMIEVPKLLFPYAREIIGNATIKAGFPPLYLQPMSFEAIYAQDLQRRQAAVEAGSASASESATQTA